MLQDAATGSPAHTAPVMAVGGDVNSAVQEPEELLVMFDEMAESAESQLSDSNTETDQPVYFK